MSVSFVWLDSVWVIFIFHISTYIQNCGCSNTSTSQDTSLTVLLSKMYSILECKSKASYHLPPNTYMLILTFNICRWPSWFHLETVTNTFPYSSNTSFQCYRDSVCSLPFMSSNRCSITCFFVVVVFFSGILGNGYAFRKKLSFSNSNTFNSIIHYVWVCWCSFPFRLSRFWLFHSCYACQLTRLIIYTA